MYKADQAIIEMLLKQKDLAPAFRKALTGISDEQQGKGRAMKEGNTIIYTLEEACADNGINPERLRACMRRWEVLSRDFQPEWLGILPAFLDEDDPRSAREQFDAKYCSGWWPIRGATITANQEMQYPGDPDSPPLARTTFRDETIVFYEYALVAIIQTDGTAEVARMD